MEEILQEIESMAMLDHPNVIKANDLIGVLQLIAFCKKRPAKSQRTLALQSSVQQTNRLVWAGL